MLTWECLGKSFDRKLRVAKVEFFGVVLKVFFDNAHRLPQRYVWVVADG